MVSVIPTPSNRREWLKLCRMLADRLMEIHKRPYALRIGDLTLTLTQFIGVCSESLGCEMESHFQNQTKTWTLKFKPGEK